MQCRSFSQSIFEDLLFFNLQALFLNIYFFFNLQARATSDPSRHLRSQFSFCFFFQMFKFLFTMESEKNILSLKFLTLSSATLGRLYFSESIL